MAAIDKTYVNKTQLLEAIEWAKSVGTVTMENGYKFKPLNYIYGYNDLDDPDFFKEERETYVLWNTPTWFDRWLWMNCPLEFVRERIKEQYDDDVKEFEEYVYHNPKDNLDFGKQHYTFLNVPKWHGHKWQMSHGRKKRPWPDKCIQLTYMMEIKAPRDGKHDFTDDLEYNSQTNTWEESFGMQPINDDYIWQKYHNHIPNKKSIIRELRHWYIPRGYIVRLYNLKYKGLDFEILVK